MAKKNANDSKTIAVKLLSFAVLYYVIYYIVSGDTPEITPLKHWEGGMQTPAQAHACMHCMNMFLSMHSCP
jgi:hypothetical protein